jgi:hypothetical protein
MKRLFAAFTLLLLITLSVNLLAQDVPVFQGYLTMSTEVVGGDLSAAERAQAETTIKMTYGIDVIKQESENVMGSNTMIVFEDSMIMLTQGMAFGAGKEAMKKMFGGGEEGDDEEKAEINYISESKEILGVECKKAEITFQEKLIIVYYNDKYTVAEFMREPYFKQLNGLAMEYIVPGENGEEIVVKATEFKPKKKMKPKAFEVPAGTEVLTLEQLRSQMGG